VTLPIGLRSLGECAFCDCDALSSVDFAPRHGHPGDRRLVVESRRAWWNAMADDMVHTPDAPMWNVAPGAPGWCAGRTPLGLIFGPRAFERCASLVSVSVAGYGWTMLCAHMLARQVSLYWCEQAAIKGCAPGGSWAERDR